MHCATQKSVFDLNDKHSQLKQEDGSKLLSFYNLCKECRKELIEKFSILNNLLSVREVKTSMKILLQNISQPIKNGG